MVVYVSVSGDCQEDMWALVNYREADAVLVDELFSSSVDGHGQIRPYFCHFQSGDGGVGETRP